MYYNSSSAIANKILEVATSQNKQLTNFQLQKLVYLTHGWSLAVTEEPLVSDSCFAYQFGEVFPSLYKNLQCYKNGVVTNKVCLVDVSNRKFIDIKPIIDEYTERLIKRVLEVYSGWNEPQLMCHTNGTDSAWYKAWNREKFSVVRDEDTREFFLELQNKN